MFSTEGSGEVLVNVVVYRRVLGIHRFLQESRAHVQRIGWTTHTLLMEYVCLQDRSGSTLYRCTIHCYNFEGV